VIVAVVVIVVLVVGVGVEVRVVWSNTISRSRVVVVEVVL